MGLDLAQELFWLPLQLQGAFFSVSALPLAFGPPALAFEFILALRFPPQLWGSLPVSRFVPWLLCSHLALRTCPCNSRPHWMTVLIVFHSCFWSFPSAFSSSSCLRFFHTPLSLTSKRTATWMFVVGGLRLQA